MCKKIEKKMQNLPHFVGNVKAKDAKVIRKAVITLCGVSSMTYSKWVRGVAIPRDERKIIINKIASSYGYKNVF